MRSGKSFSRCTAPGSSTRGWTGCISQRHERCSELYDLEHDPNEFNNLAGKPEAAGVERELKAALQEWMILERDYLPLPVPPQ